MATSVGTITEPGHSRCRFKKAASSVLGRSSRSHETDDKMDDVDALIQEMKNEQVGAAHYVRPKAARDVTAAASKGKSKQKVVETRLKKARAQRTCSPSQLPGASNMLPGAADDVVVNFGADVPSEDKWRLPEEYTRVMSDWGHGGVVAGASRHSSRQPHSCFPRPSACPLRLPSPHRHRTAHRTHCAHHLSSVQIRGVAFVRRRQCASQSAHATDGSDRANPS